MNQIYKLSSLFIGLFVYLFIGLLVVLPGKASAFSVSVSPPIIQIDAKNPVSISTPFTIENMSQKTTEFEILLKPFKANNNLSGDVFYMSENEAFSQKPDPSIFEKIKILDEKTIISDIVLPPSQKKSLTLSIDLPKDEPPADYYFSIIFMSKENSQLSSQEKSGSQTIGGVGINVLLSIGPKKPTKATIEEFWTPFFTTSSPVDFILRIQNKSDHFITPVGSIIITNMFNQAVGKVDLLPVNILSQSVRRIPGKDGENVSSLSWREHFVFGFYTGRLTVASSENGPVFSKTVRFIALPPSALVFIGFTILLSLYITKRIFLRR